MVFAEGPFPNSRRCENLQSHSPRRAEKEISPGGKNSQTVRPSKHRKVHRVSLSPQLKLILRI